MSNRTLLFFSAIIVACVLALFAVNFSQIFFATQQGKFLDPGFVAGVEVYHKNIPYTLNFEQQNEFIELINICNKVRKEHYPTHSFELPFEKIVVYQFNKSPLEIIPIILAKRENLIFDVVDWNPNGYILDMSGGRLLNLIKSTYDD